MVGGDWEEQSGRVHLVALWVEPSSRGKGVGKALVAEVLVWARERQAQRVEPWVVDDAPAAAALYASCGFVETGVHQAVPHWPGQKEKLLVRMTWPLVLRGNPTVAPQRGGPAPFASLR